jgi:hypothetical protein
MSKQCVNLSRVIVGAALLVAASASVGHAQDRIVANVPFAFIVGNAQLPAGNYVVTERFDDPTIVTIVSEDGRHVANTLTIAGGSGSQPQASLVFEKFEGRYFLKRVTADAGNEREIVLTPARMEHELVTAAPDNP